MHYVIGDVHGCYKELMALLGKIEEQDKDARIIFVGDFMDRGPQVWDVLEWAMQNITPDGKYQSVRGNHEEMILDWYREWLKWWNAGGFAGCGAVMPDTYYDFVDWAENKGCLTQEKLEPIMEFFRSLPCQKELRLNLGAGEIVYQIVHAWIPEREDMTEEERKDCNLWLRRYGGNQVSEDIIVHGHTPTVAIEYACNTSMAPGMISYRHNAINVDGGCVFQDEYYRYPCMLCAICLETLEEIYPCTVDERFRQIYREGAKTVDEAMEAYRKQYLQKDNWYRWEMLERLEKLRKPNEEK